VTSPDKQIGDWSSNCALADR